MARPDGGASRSGSSTGSSRATSTRRGRELAAFLGRRSRRPRVRPQRDDRRQHRPALAAVRAGRRAAGHRPRVQRDAQRDPRGRRARRARRSSSRESRSRSRSPTQVVEAILAAVTPRTRLAAGQPRDEPTALVLPIDGIVARAGRARRRHARRWRACAGHGAARPGRLGAAYWTGNAHKWLCAPKGAGFSTSARDRQATDPAARRLARRQLAAHGPVALPARVRLDRARRPVAVSSRCPRRSASWRARCRRLAGGSWRPTARWRARPGPAVRGARRRRRPRRTR